MDEYQLGKEIASILSRLDALERDRSKNLVDEASLLSRTESPTPSLELFGLEPLTIPPRKALEPFETEPSGGKWLCDPKVINVLKLNGADLPYQSLVLYSAIEITWTPQAGAPPYTTACPRTESGGAFPQLKLHALVFGLGARGIGCQSRFGIEGSPGSPVWVAVNDSSYNDNDGRIVVRVRWR